MAVHDRHTGQPIVCFGHPKPTFHETVGALSSSGVPIGIATNALLGALSLACQGHIECQWPGGNTLPVSLFLMTVAQSGKGKTIAESFAFRPFHLLKEFIDTSNTKEDQKYISDHTIWKTQEKILHKQLTKATENNSDVDDIIKKIHLHQNKKPKLPAKICFIHSDATIPALTQAYSKSFPSTSIVNSDAGDTLLQNFSTTQLPTLNKLWDGEPYSSSRVSTGSVDVKNPRLTLALGLQPELVIRFIERKSNTSKENGFFGRTLVYKHTDTLDVEAKPETEVTKYLSAEYEKIAKEIIEESIESMKTNTPPHVMHLSDKALEIWNSYTSKIDDDINDSNYSGIRESLIKSKGNLLKIASIIHYFNHGKSFISKDSMENAVEVMNKFIEGDLQLEKMRNHEEPDQLASKLLDWLNTYFTGKLCTTIKVRDARVLCPNSLRKNNRFKTAMSYLLENKNIYETIQDGSAAIVLANNNQNLSPPFAQFTPSFQNPYQNNQSTLRDHATKIYEENPMRNIFCHKG